MITALVAVLTVTCNCNDTLRYVTMEGIENLSYDVVWAGDSSIKPGSTSLSVAGGNLTLEETKNSSTCSYSGAWAADENKFDLSTGTNLVTGCERVNLRDTLEEWERNPTLTDSKSYRGRVTAFYSDWVFMGTKSLEENDISLVVGQRMLASNPTVANSAKVAPQ